jgi:hypothetical protein
MTITIVFPPLTVCLGSQNSNELRAGQQGFDSRQEQEIFLYFTASRQALGSTHPPIRQVQGPTSREVKRPGREGDRPLTSI